MFRHLSKRFAAGFVIVALLLGGFAGLHSNAAAGPEIVGDPVGATSRFLISDNQSVRRIVYISQGAHTRGANTPTVDGSSCGNFGDLHSLEFDFTGTMTGTSPTLSIAWQNSYDGSTWYTIATTVPLNTTAVTTPANLNQKLTAADVKNALSSTAYGDCWRALTTFGGTGTLTGNYKIVGIEK